MDESVARQMAQHGGFKRVCKNGHCSQDSRRRLNESLRICSSSSRPATAARAALDGLIRRYTPFVRLKASAYFLVGGGNDDLIQEGLIGLYKAVRDFRPDKETSFRSFAELCVTRQIITAIKTATRYKHSPLNTLRLVQPHARRPGARRRLHARRRAARLGRQRPGRSA